MPSQRHASDAVKEATKEGKETKEAKAVARDAAALDAFSALRAATLGGAKAIGFDDRVGSIEPGKEADLVCVDLSALETQPLKIDWTFWCYQCGGMASAKTCPHGEKDRLLVSGTKLRKWLSEGDAVPAEFSRPEVLAILRDYYATIKDEVKVEVKLTECWR